MLQAPTLCIESEKESILSWVLTTTLVGGLANQRQLLNCLGMLNDIYIYIYIYFFWQQKPCRLD